MSAVLKCFLTCDGCGVPYEDSTLFNSVSEAQAAAWKAGWMSDRMCTRIFDFCPACQEQAKEGKRESVAAKAK